jgi:hypothetical protein
MQKGKGGKSGAGTGASDVAARREKMAAAAEARMRQASVRSHP